MDAVGESERWNAVKPNRLGNRRKKNSAERAAITPRVPIVPIMRNVSYHMVQSRRHAGTMLRLRLVVGPRHGVRI